MGPLTAPTNFIALLMIFCVERRSGRPELASHLSRPHFVPPHIRVSKYLEKGIRLFPLTLGLTAGAESRTQCPFMVRAIGRVKWWAGLRLFGSIS